MNATITTLEGKLSAMKRDEYDADTKRLRATSLKDLVIPEQGPRAYCLKHVTPIKDDDADGNHFILGNLLHEWILEGKQNWAVATMRRDERTKAYQEFMAENAGKAIITAKEEMELCWWREGVMRNKEARRLLSLPRHEEQVVLWHEEVDFVGPDNEPHSMLVPCKAAIDLWPFSESSRYCLKTDAALSGWENTVFRLGYHVQAAWYERGVRSIPEYRDAPPAFGHIVVQKKAPYWCYVRPLSDAALGMGDKLCEIALYRYCYGMRAMELGYDPLDAWPDLLEQKQLTPVIPPNWVSIEYGEKHSEPVTSHDPVDYEEGTNGYDIPESARDYYRELARSAG